MSLSDGDDVVESSDPADKQIKAIAASLQRLKKKASVSRSIKKRFEKLDTMLASLQTRMRRMEADVSCKLEQNMTVYARKLVSFENNILSSFKASMKELLAANRDLQRQSSERLQDEVQLIKRLLEARQCAPDPNSMEKGAKKLEDCDTRKKHGEEPEVQSKVSDCGIFNLKETVPVAGPNLLEKTLSDEPAVAASVSKPQAQTSTAGKRPTRSRSKRSAHGSAPESRCCSSSSDAVQVQPKVDEVVRQVQAAKEGSRRRFGAQLRRVTVKFTDTDVELLVKAIEKLGPGRWQDVKRGYFAHDENHNASDLKDKWRSLLRSAMLSSQQRRSTLSPGLAKRILAIHRANNAF